MFPQHIRFTKQFRNPTNDRQHLMPTDKRVYSLPEVRLGLIPGAGGTVSLPRRIGRHRTLSLALSGVPIDAGTARAWGLVDDVDS